MLQKKPEANWEAGSKRVAVAEVAQKSGVSVATVYRVLRGEPYVSAATRDAILKVLHELGYAPHQSQQRPVELIGVTSLTMIDAYYTKILGGVTEALHARNAHPIICPIPWRHNCGATFLERVLHTETSGALILGLTEPEDEIVEVQKSGVYPFVLVDPERVAHESLPVVATARKAGVQAAIDYLIGLGHRRIAAITGVHGHRDNADLQDGYCAALSVVDLPMPPEFISQGGATVEHGYQVAHRLLSLPNPPTAIFAFNSAMALGVLDAARERGLLIPSDLSLIVFNDSEIAQMSRPALTSVYLPLMEVGGAAADMLYRLILRVRNGQPLEGTRLEISTRLKIRGSTAPPPEVK